MMIMIIITMTIKMVVMMIILTMTIITVLTMRTITIKLEITIFMVYSTRRHYNTLNNLK